MVKEYNIQGLELKKRSSKKARYLWIAGLIVVLILVYYLVSILLTYSDYTVKISSERSDSTGTKYVDFQNNLLKYSADGAFYTDYTGKLIWNETFEMSKPMLDVCGSYVLLYDKTGTQMIAMTATGAKGDIKTAYPIICANISSNGVISALSSKDDRYYLALYNLDSEVIASGELYPENSGYPVAISLSKDGTKLAVSCININGGDIKTTLTIYDFGKNGDKNKNNVAATFTYIDMIMPRVSYLNNGELVAFGTNEVVLFSNASEPKMKKEIFVNSEIQSVLVGEGRFGIIYDDVDKEGKAVTKMDMYSKSGRRIYSKSIDNNYQECKMLNNDEVLLKNSSEVWLYSKHGILKYQDEYDSSIFEIIPSDGIKNYVFIKNGITEEVKLK